MPNNQFHAKNTFECYALRNQWLSHAHLLGGTSSTALQTFFESQNISSTFRY